MEVDVGALRDNARAVARASGTPLIPMVKADAYGVGVESAVAALTRAGDIDIAALGVATVVEGAELRRRGVDRPVIVFTPLLPADFAAARAARLTPALSTAAQIIQWSASGGPYHLSIDTGMSRAGTSWRDVTPLRDAVRLHPPEGVFTHFHSAESDDGSASAQLRVFEEAVATLELDAIPRHAANSAAIARGIATGSGWSAVRPGVFLYGVGSGPGASLHPAPVVQVRARIVDLRWLEPGDTVSYGATYRTTRRERVATVAAGYADGYPRAAGNRATALIRGRRVPVRGVVTMDMTMLDVTDVTCSIGDTATLIGNDGSEMVSVEEVASAAGMSPYELLTGLTSRLTREPVDR